MKHTETKELSSQEKSFVNEIRALLLESRRQTYTAVNAVMAQTYWQIGKRIVEQEQNGKSRADYGSFLIRNLSKALTAEFGQGLSVANLKNFRQFYLTYPNGYTVCSLSWSHIRLIMRLDSEEERDYYTNEAVEQNLSVRALERKIKTHDYKRIVSNQVSKKSKSSKISNSDFVKDPYILEFLGFEQSADFIESDLEKAIITHIQKMLLEMGKGFSFVARQMRISTETKHFYIDLVFYNYILKCFVLVDLKTGELTHQDVGQMEMYVRMFDDLKRGEGDNPTIGIIFCEHKDETIVKYSVLNESEQIFASKYKMVLPTEEELKREIERQKFLESEKCTN